MFISHAGSDSGDLAGWLHRELGLHGLSAFLDEDPHCIPAGPPWAEQLRKGVWTCRVLIVLLSPSFWLRAWPVRELRIALERTQRQADSPEQPGAFTIIPVYAGWTRQQAAASLQHAAEQQDDQLTFTTADGRTTTTGNFLQQPRGRPGQQQDEAATALHPAEQAWQQLRQLFTLQQANTQRSEQEHSKLGEPKLVTELVQLCLGLIPKRFKVPKGEECSNMHQHQSSGCALSTVQTAADCALSQEAGVQAWWGRSA